MAYTHKPMQWMSFDGFAGLVDPDQEMSNEHLIPLYILPVSESCLLMQNKCTMYRRDILWNWKWERKDTCFFGNQPIYHKPKQIIKIERRNRETGDSSSCASSDSDGYPRRHHSHLQQGQQLPACSHLEFSDPSPCAPASTCDAAHHWAWCF